MVLWNTLVHAFFKTLFKLTNLSGSFGFCLKVKFAALKKDLLE